MTPQLRQAVSSGASVNDLSQYLPDSFRTMRQAGIQRAIEGVTTVPEVLRATQDAEETYQ